MNRDVVHARGNAAPSCLPPERALGDHKACRDEATAAQGPLAESASKPFISEGQPLGGIESQTLPPTAPADQGERQLLAAISAGNRSALARLYFLYFQKLAKFFGHLIAASTADVIEDLITETMFRVWRDCSTLTPQISVHIWIMRIAYLCGSERLTRYDRLSRSSAKPRLRSPPGDKGATSRLESSVKGLDEFLGMLSARERAVVHFVYSGHSRQEVAYILSMSLHSIDVYLARSMVTLCPWLAAEAVGAAGSA